MRLKAVVFFFVAALSCSHYLSAEPLLPQHNNVKTVNHAFAPGEKLTYSISWSKFLQAGVAVQEIKEELTPDGKRIYRFVSTTRSVGMVEAFYPVRDTVESIVDAEDLSSVSFSLKQNHGGKKRHRELAFDRKNKTVRIAIDDDKPETLTVPDRVQDSLSSLYYVRTRQDFTVEKPILVDIVDGGKLWLVEVYTLGKERIKTPAGEFNTIKIKTYPKYEGVFMHKGEIFIWVTDDERKIPVLMQSKIAIGSIVVTLTNIQGGKDKP